MKTVKILNKSSAQQSLHLNINIDISKLTAFEEQLGKHFKTHVGILGNRNNRATLSRAGTGKAKVTQNETLATATNAMIGFVHEFGSYTAKIPERSFLRVPLMLFLGTAVNEASGKINKAIEMADVARAYAILGIAAEKVIQEAFATGGNGSWPKLKSMTIARKGSSAILIDSGQLRKSITSKVVEA